ncbi:Fe3+ hydroxamate ABC transporter substrate-binding protein [Allobacillus sp. GCM10007491]|uniref:Fe3+ hydroxamate ABC transporter substrate-binding protein n=1 Tax=Allobacillus saliphilus TaxID=2912308 RepID=A0A941CXE7_9BACI|nr:Fe3+ hydroxamate ABC transporter substrate-binding protein [Allobacillus saliphilus]MBR7554461.1 Fe3+ hydroxamate ABC transporter substrate-binding protein [Allobacillus saliphilus]
MLEDKPKCIECGKEIEAEDDVFVKMRYPKRKGFTEIKAYLSNEGKFICESCFNKDSNLKR